MTEFLAALADPSLPFFRYAVLTGIFASIPFGVIGTYVVVRRISYIAGAISPLHPRRGRGRALPPERPRRQLVRPAARGRRRRPHGLPDPGDGQHARQAA